MNFPFYYWLKVSGCCFTMRFQLKHSFYMSESNKSLSSSFQGLFYQNFNWNSLRKLCWQLPSAGTDFFARMLQFIVHSSVLCYILKVKESWSNYDWKGSLRLPSSTLCKSSTGPTSKLDQISQGRTEILSKDGDSIDSLSNLLQCLITLITKAIILISKLNFPCCLLYFHCGFWR